MKKILVCFICLYLPLLAYSDEGQTIYKTTDEQGNVLFTDKPAKGATEIEVAPVQSYSPPSGVNVPTSTNDNTNPQSNAPVAKGAYNSIELKEPAVDAGGDTATIWSNPGTLNVSVSLNPPLQPGDQVQILLDGKVVAQAKDVTQFSIDSVYPGAHTLSAQVISLSGNVLISSEVRKIYMHRIGQNSPQRLSQLSSGPTVR